MFTVVVRSISKPWIKNMLGWSVRVNRDLKNCARNFKDGNGKWCYFVVSPCTGSTIKIRYWFTKIEWTFNPYSHNNLASLCRPSCSLLPINSRKKLSDIILKRRCNSCACTVTKKQAGKLVHHSNQSIITCPVSSLRNSSLFQVYPKR